MAHQTPKERIVAALKKDRRYKFRELKAIGRTTNQGLTDIFRELRGEGYKIVLNKLDRTYFLSRIPTPYSDYYDMGWLPKAGVIGLISDTHLCSNAERLDLCEQAYDAFGKEGVRTVLHTGDISDGWNVYKNHQTFVKCVGAQNQAKYVIDHYPRRPQMRTFFIGGNHDIRVFEQLGIDTCSLITQGFVHENAYVEPRKDMVYLGQYSRYLLWPDEVTVHMLHPRGGGSYAISYAQQKRHREMKTESRPNIQVSGHYHTFSFIRQDYTFMIAMPGLQDLTEFFVREGYSRQMGCCIMRYAIENRNISRLVLEYVDLAG